MARLHTNIGFTDTVETTPGVWEDVVIERPYYGDIIRNARRITLTDKINSDVSISNEFSIVADGYATDNIFHMRYIWFKGAKWRITDVQVEYPRIILTVGGLYV